MNKKQQQINERELAREELQKLTKQHDTIYTVLTHVSSSGMSRNFKVLIVNKDKTIRNISYSVAQALDLKLSKNYDVTIAGCGMDMAYHLVYLLGGALGYSTSGMPAPESNCYGLNHKSL